MIDINFIEECEDHLNGMYWTENFNFKFKKLDNVEQSVSHFNKNLARLCSFTLNVLENINASEEDVKSVIEGNNNSRLNFTDVNKVKNFVRASYELEDLVLTNKFKCSIDVSKDIHYFSGAEINQAAGSLRHTNVTISGTKYIPPTPYLLLSLKDEGFNYLQTIEDPKTRAVATFLFMSRSQFFQDVNKRTASLIMNGILMNECYACFDFSAVDKQTFLKELVNFYETGNADNIMRLFCNIFV